MKYLFSFLLAVVLSVNVAYAKTFLVDANLSTNVTDELLEAHNQDGGTYALYKGKFYRIGVTAFRTLSEFAAVQSTCGVTSGDTLYVAPGVYAAGATISVDGLTILGHNANHDWTTTTSRSVLESEIQAVVYIEASNITVNGFKFTGAGRLESNDGTNAAPFSNIKVLYNYFCNSTVERANSKPLVELGPRAAGATAPTTASQLRYLNCEVAHNYFYFPSGTTTTYPNGVAVCGAGGTTRIHDNYFNSSGTSVAIENGQGDIYVTHNVFKNIGANTQNATGSGDDKKGDFAIMLYRNAYDNTTNAYIQDNEFDGCQGQAALGAIIRVFAGDIGETDFVTPVNYKININRNTFKGKTTIVDSNIMAATSSATDQAGENIILYQDNQNVYDNTLYNIQDNHYDNRLYKYAWIRLEDGLARQEIYANNFTQFVFGGKYSTFGTESHLSANITDHAAYNSGTGISHYPNTVIQSFDIDMETGDLYFIQKLRTTDNNTLCAEYGLTADYEEGLILTRVPCTQKAVAHTTNATKKGYTYGTDYEYMKLLRAGHGVKLQVVRDKNGQLWMLTGGKGTQRASSSDNSESGTCVAKFKFVAGAQAILDGTGSSADVGVSNMSLSFIEHPISGLKNVYGAVDELSRYFCFSSSGGGRQYCIYDLDDILEGKSNPRFIKRIDMTSSSTALSTAVAGTAIDYTDPGWGKLSYQSYAIAGDYLYFLEGVSDENSSTLTSGNPTIIVSTYNWRTGQYLLRTRVNYGRTNKEFGEPEGMTVRPDIYGHSTFYIALADGVSGARQASIYKWHINRYLDVQDAEAGYSTLAYTTYGDDTQTTSTHFNTSQYSGISFSADKTSLAYTSSKPGEDVATQNVTITNSGEYRYGSWVGTISGTDGGRFTVEVSDNEQFQTETITATVKFIPDGKKRDYSAQLRLHSPLATSNVESNDIVIPLTATYTGNIVRESSPNRPYVETYQVTETATDGETLYSFNLAMDAMLPSQYDNAYLAYTNGNAADVLPFRQLIDHYVVEIDPDADVAITEDQVTHLTIGTDNSAEQKSYASEIGDKEVENVFVIDGYTEGGTVYPSAITTDDVFVASMTVPNAIKVSQADASDTRDDATVNYTSYSQVFNKPLVFHNVDPTKNYPFKVFLSGSAKYSDAWQALLLDYYDGTHSGYDNYVAGGYKSPTMVIPGTKYNHLSFSVDEVEVPEGVETPFNTDRSLSAMPMGVGGVTLTDPIHYTKANVISSVGGFDRLCVTDEVLNNWDVDYNISVAMTDNDSNDYGAFASTYSISESGNGEILVNLDGVNDNVKGNAGSISYLPIKVGDKVVVDNNDESIAYNALSTDKYYSIKPTMNVSYERIGKFTDAAETTTISGVDNQSAIIDAQENQTAIDIKELPGSVSAVTNLSASGEQLYYVKVGDYYICDAVTRVQWTQPTGFPVHAIGYHFDNGYGDKGENLADKKSTYKHGGHVMSQQLLDDYGFSNHTALQGYKLPDYVDYSDSYSDVNNWSEIAAEQAMLPVFVNHIYDMVTPINPSEYSSKIGDITATITSEYPFLFYNSSAGAYKPIVEISESEAGTSDVALADFNASEISLFSTEADISIPTILSVADAASTTIQFSDLTTGVGNVNVDEADIRIYPNPAEDRVNVVSMSKLGLVEIYSVDGQLVKSQETEDMGTIIEVGNLPSGTYILRAIGKSTLLLKK